ncbi:PfkB family carbohydrate kinase [Cryobacterium sp. PH31-L1]|uniref:PfkB family carbohydrate kinase n=1 Tax=Cryobacterium sp. PH31-L1 TaxID=3046199 RepID=UPI0024BA9230|nr:PfkB family carbohydrate kinase [Cryobacterium sp. PH31-L1]MDJ0378293.1 PfkB family carbohydrate kinase [Cryobacterium sp. PH31-L1]
MSHLASSATTLPGSVVVVGSINVDQLIRVQRHPKPGETLIGTSMKFLPGGKGAICADREGTNAVASPTIVAVDSAGAGDAFVGALSTPLTGGGSLLQAVRPAARVGAFAVQIRGTQTSYQRVSNVLPTVNA